MTNRWNNKADFAVAMKAAAWEATRRMVGKKTPGTGLPMMCAMGAAEDMNIVDEYAVANVDRDVIFRSVYALAFVQGNDTFVEQEIDRAWLEYAGMGTKANAA